MKLKAILLACLVAGFSASFALADDGGHGGHHGRHHEHQSTTTTTNAAGCTQVELRGTLASVSASSFTLMVTKAEAGDENDGDDDDDNNAASPNLVGQTLTIAVDANTEVSFKTVGALTGPAVGDSAKVEANMCGTPATFTATSVKAQGKALGTAQNLKSKHH